jgi:hypothetical protein
MNFFKKNKSAPSEAQHKDTQQKPQEWWLQSKNTRTEEQTEEKATKRKNPLRALGFIALAVIVVANYLSDPLPRVATGQEAVDALNTGMSDKLGAGVRLLENDSTQLPVGDYNVTFRSEGDASDGQEKRTIELLVWDYAAVDGDYIQVFYNGNAFGDAFMIKHSPQAFHLNVTPGVPVTLQIKGIKDGGGGITYAAMFQYKQHHATYYNRAPVAGSNAYTITLIP